MHRGVRKAERKSAKMDDSTRVDGTNLLRVSERPGFIVSPGSVVVGGMKG